MGHFRFSGIMFLLISCLISLSCAGGKNPSEPKIPEQADIWDSPSFNDSGISSDRQVIAVYDATIDLEVKTFVVTPSKERVLDFHAPLTTYFPNTLKITDYGWSPQFWANITLTHPAPGSGITLYDPRVIAIIPANPGFSFTYPSIGVNGNNSTVLNHDGYTGLFDNLGGSIPGNVNPFKSYFKITSYRAWKSSGMTQDTQQWLLNLNGFGGPIIFKLVVDVSTNYPNPSRPIIDNAPEPVEISATSDQGLFSTGGEANVEVTLTDWQGSDGISVAVEAPELFDGLVNLNYDRPGSNPNEYIFKGKIRNQYLAPEGDYKFLVAAWDQSSGVHIFNEFTTTVNNNINFNISEIPTPWVKCNPSDICFDGIHAFMASKEYGIHIFDMTDPLNPVWLKNISTEGSAKSVSTSDGYLFVAENTNGIQIIDVDPIDSAYVVKTLDTNDAYEIVILNGYAYVADGSSGLQIIDIDPPQNAYVVNTVDTEMAYDVCVANGLAYLADGSGSFKILDIDPPESAYILKHVTSYEYKTIQISGDYAYLVTQAYLNIYDINPPESAMLVDILNIQGGGTSGYDLGYKDGYVFVSCGTNGVKVIDVDPLPPSVVQTVSFRSEVLGIDIYGNHLYTMGMIGSTFVIDIQTPTQSKIVGVFGSPNRSKGVYLSRNDLWIASGYDSFWYANMSQSPSTQLAKGIYCYGWVDIIYTDGGLAYIGDNYTWKQYFDIYSISPINEAQLIRSIELDFCGGITVRGDYAYIASGDGLVIVDINPPDLAYIAKIIDTPSSANGITISGSYAFVTTGDSGLQIIRIDPIGSEDIVNSINTPGNAQDVCVVNGYAYVADDTYGLQIIDIDPVDTAYLVKTVDTPGNAVNLSIAGGYAYVADDYYGIQIIDIDPISSASIITSFSNGGHAVNVLNSLNVLYVSYESSGLRIFELW